MKHNKSNFIKKFARDFLLTLCFVKIAENRFQTVLFIIKEAGHVRSNQRTTVPFYRKKSVQLFCCSSDRKRAGGERVPGTEGEGGMEDPGGRKVFYPEKRIFRYRVLCAGERVQRVSHHRVPYGFSFI